MATPAAPLARFKDAAPGLNTKLAVIVPLGLTQTLAWASSYYLLAILAEPIARDTHVPTTVVFAAFSGALLVSAMIGPHVGRKIDKFGGRLVLVLSNVSFALGLAVLAASASWRLLFLAWLCSLGSAWGWGFTMLPLPRWGAFTGWQPGLLYCHHPDGRFREYCRMAADRLGLE
jgi:MFS family permease